ncbi:MAG TPA: GTP cyclohydrolase I FolE [Gemmatimonadaceae bacterium]|nr:GTP cyclohydrolase I FolE [Gemmatimonadaceae bacterium]
MSDINSGDRPQIRRRPSGEMVRATPPVVGSLALQSDAWHEADRAPALAALVRRQLELLGENPDREGLLRTPERVAKSLGWLTHGYHLEPTDVIGDAIFGEEHQNMVLVRDIEMYSLCEHHMLPFFGKVHIAYIPNGRIVGLSKLPRLVEVFARRLQVQERLTEQVADALEQVLQPRAVGVVVEAVHLCMMMRGVEKQNSKTITSALRGEFRTCPMARAEFLGLAHRGE